MTLHPVALCVLVPLWLLSTACFEAELFVKPNGSDASDAGPDGSLTDGGAHGEHDANGPPPARAHHAACALPLPADLPDPPSAADVHLIRNDWKHRSCLDVPSPVFCDATHPCADAAPCLLTKGAQGVCGSANVWDRIDVPFSYRDDHCRRLVRGEFKRSVCCAQIPGVDCREWPFENTSKPGGACAQRNDCEAGLLCTAPSDAGYGICTCPGVSAEQVLAEGSDCERVWKEDVVPVPPLVPMEPGQCKAAKADGYVVQALPRNAGNHLLGAERMPASEVIVVLTSDDTDQLKLARGVDNHWLVESVPTLTQREADLAAGVDRVHVVTGQHQTLTHLARDENGNWHSTDLSSFVAGALLGLKIHLRGDGRPLIVATEKANASAERHLFSLSYSLLGTWIKEVHALSLVDDDIGTLDVRVGADERTHVLLRHQGSLHHVVMGDEQPLSTSLGPRLAWSFVRVMPLEVDPSSPLEWASVVQDELVTSIVRDQLGVENAQTSLWSSGSGSPRTPVPSVARSSRNRLYAAFRSDEGPDLKGIVLANLASGHTFQTLLTDDAFDPVLVLDRDQEPHAFYEFAQAPSEASPNPESQIQQVFAGQCPTTRHPSCDEDLTELPAQPALFFQSGRPRFDLWRDIDCADVADYPLCQNNAFQSSPTWSCDLCWSAEPSIAGVCSSIAASESCSGQELGFVSIAGGRCRACAPIEAKARACCAGLLGFDCRAWPYDSDSDRGEDCARHEDCEPGLVCKSERGQQGTCACPSETLNRYRAPFFCGAAGESGRCRPSDVAGFGYAFLPAEVGLSLIATAASSAGDLFVLARDSAAGRTSLAAWKDGQWQAAPLPVQGSGAATIAVDKQGRVHAVLMEQGKLNYLRLALDGTWRTRILEAGAGPQFVGLSLALDADDAPIITYGMRAPPGGATLHAMFSGGDPFADEWTRVELTRLKGFPVPLDTAVNAVGELQVLYRDTSTFLVHYLLATPQGGRSIFTSTERYIYTSPVVDSAGLHEWISVREGEQAIRIHTLGEATPEGKPLLPPGGFTSYGPSAVRKPSGELMVERPTSTGTYLYEISGSHVSEARINDESMSHSLLLIDAASRLHVFSPARLAQTAANDARSISIRHLMEWTCTEEGP